jgi:pyruvate/2-oxoacid:ferredoxin oxidoreductase beta subunit
VESFALVPREKSLLVHRPEDLLLTKESTAALLRAEACKLAQALEDPSVPKWTSRKEPSELEERLMHLQESELKGRSQPMWEALAEQLQEVLEQE